MSEDKVLVGGQDATQHWLLSASELPDALDFAHPQKLKTPAMLRLTCIWSEVTFLPLF
jgi:hypothetical protein